MGQNLLNKVRKVSSIIVGLASTNRRASSASRLLAYTLNSMSPASMKQYLEYAPRLPNIVLAEARVYADRQAMLERLPKGGTVAEVGVWRGEFSQVIAETCQPDEFHLIDVDLRPLGPVPDHVITHEGDSSTILATFPALHFDWLYIDGDHSFDGVKKDLKAAHLALKSGGYLMCNDYSNWCSAEAMPYGIARAVNEMIIDEGYAVVGLALHPAGLHDILIRKP